MTMKMNEDTQTLEISEETGKYCASASQDMWPDYSK